MKQDTTTDKQRELLTKRHEAKKLYGSDSPEYRAIQAKLNYLINPDKVKEANKRYKKTHRIQINAYQRNRRLNNEELRIKHNLITRAYYNSHKKEFLQYSKTRRKDKTRINAERALAMLRHWLKSPRFPNFSPSYKPRSLFKVIGCSGRDFKAHIESFFTPDMNWQNHGSIWHFCHINPIRNFDCSQLDQLYKCFHFSNLRPDTIHNNQRRINEVIPQE